MVCVVVCLTTPQRRGGGGGGTCKSGDPNTWHPNISNLKVWDPNLGDQNFKT